MFIVIKLFFVGSYIVFEKYSLFGIFLINLLIIFYNLKQNIEDSLEMLGVKLKYIQGEYYIQLLKSYC